MPANRLFKRSIHLALAATLIALPFQGPMAAFSDESITAQDVDPAVAYTAAQTAIRGDQPDQAREELARVQANPDGTWQTIGRSASLLVDGDIDGARAAAQQAVDANGESPWTHYHLGFVAYRQNDWAVAASESERATQLNGDLAYAHYFAGLAFQKQRQSAKAAEHLQAFLRLAPDAPERAAVTTIIRTLG